MQRGGKIPLTNMQNINIVCVLSCFSRVWLFAPLWTAPCQASLSMGVSRQGYWSGLHALLQRIFPTQGSNPHLALAGRFFTTGTTWDAREVQTLGNLKLHFKPREEKPNIVVCRLVSQGLWLTLLFEVVLGDDGTWGAGGCSWFLWDSVSSLCLRAAVTLTSFRS